MPAAAAGKSYAVGCPGVTLKIIIRSSKVPLGRRMLLGLHYRAVRTCGPILLLIVGVILPATSAAEPAAKVDFPHVIVPILKAHCVECHGGHRHEGECSINTREAILIAGAVEPGKAADSHLIDLVTSQDKKERMPKGKPALSAAEIKSLRVWID